jgi:hypothetical protein
MTFQEQVALYDKTIPINIEWSSEHEKIEKKKYNCNSNDLLKTVRKFLRHTSSFRKPTDQGEMDKHTRA